MMGSEQSRLLELLDCILDKSYSDAEQQEFIQLMDENAQLAEEVVDQLRTHSLLQWQSDKWQIDSRGVAIPPAAAIVPFQFPSESVPHRLLRIVTKRWVWAAAAIFLMISAAIAWHQIQQSDHSQLALAEVVDSNLVKWSDTSTALLDPMHVVAGKLEMTSGKLTLRFRSGATMWVSGPASMQIVSDMLVKLNNGQATAHVPEWAHGFSIDTSNVHVVDLGTKFGVVARSGGTTDVVVFEGQVDLQPTVHSSVTQKRLSQGEGVRVDNQGSVDRIMEVRSDLRGDKWSTQSPEWTETTFKSIHDNIPSADSPTYYQITPHGLEDDCRAYVDCEHQWNGLTSEGLPDFLLQADYVRTCNDYRYINDLEITVELAQPAMVYVFFDRRVKKLPAWLTDQFENTGIDIGLDEGPWWKGDTKHSVGVGGGQSIDQVCRVWQRRCETPETIRLGAMGTMKGARAMYGIAAKPLD